MTTDHKLSFEEIIGSDVIHPQTRQAIGFITGIQFNEASVEFSIQFIPQEVEAGDTPVV